MKVGDTVELVQPVIKGQIKDTQYNKDALCLEHLLHYVDSNGDVQNRWFKESELKVTV